MRVEFTPLLINPFVHFPLNQYNSNKIIKRDTQYVVIKFESYICLDYTSLSYFFTFYIYETDKLFPFCRLIPELIKEFLNNPQNQKNAIFPKHKDKAKNLNDLTFTKRVYIYYETTLPPYYENRIEDILKQSDLSPILFSKYQFENK